MLKKIFFNQLHLLKRFKDFKSTTFAQDIRSFIVHANHEQKIRRVHSFCVKLIVGEKEIQSQWIDCGLEYICIWIFPTDGDPSELIEIPYRDIKKVIQEKVYISVFLGDESEVCLSHLFSDQDDMSFKIEMNPNGIEKFRN